MKQSMQGLAVPPLTTREFHPVTDFHDSQFNKITVYYVWMSHEKSDYFKQHKPEGHLADIFISYQI
jgi:hypothetical protein